MYIKTKKDYAKRQQDFLTKRTVPADKHWVFVCGVSVTFAFLLMIFDLTK